MQVRSAADAQRDFAATCAGGANGTLWRKFNNRSDRRMYYDVLVQCVAW